MGFRMKGLHPTPRLCWCDVQVQLWRYLCKTPALCDQHSVQSWLCRGTPELCGKIHSSLNSSYTVNKYPCCHILPSAHFSNHNFLLISHDVNAPVERNNPMLLLQHERCYLSLLMAKYLCQRKFTADHLVLTINTVTKVYSVERSGSSRSTMGPLCLSKALM